MTISRREFLGGMLAGLGAVLAHKLPKAMTAEREAQEAEPIECNMGRGSPHVFDNFGISMATLPRITDSYLIDKSNVTFTLLGDFTTIAVPGNQLCFSGWGVPETLATIASAQFDGEYTEVRAFA